MNKKYYAQVELWLILSFLNSLGWVFGLILTSFITEGITSDLSTMIGLIIAGILGGLVISFLSMLIMRAFVKTTAIWVLCTTSGWILGLSGTLFSIQWLGGSIGWLIGGAFGGLIFGLLQSFGFNSDFDGKTILWLMLNALGWASAYEFGYALPADLGLNQISSINTVLSKGMLGWVLFGTLAGLLLTLLFSTLKRSDRGDRIQWLP